MTDQSHQKKTMKMNAATPTRGRRALALSSLVSLGLVLGAGVIAWFGVFGGKSSELVPEVVTIASAEAPAEGGSSFRRVSIGSLPTRIIVSSVAVDAPISEVGVVVVDGRATWETAWKAAGHHIDSALPGQPGNMIITGHVSVADRNNRAVFSQLNQVAAGDVVEVYAGDDVFVYVVERVMVVPPSAVKLLRSTSTSTVTLVTCTRDLKNRLVVTAKLQG